MWDRSIRIFHLSLWSLYDSFRPDFSTMAELVLWRNEFPERHDPFPVDRRFHLARAPSVQHNCKVAAPGGNQERTISPLGLDRKSTRLNSSH